MRSHLLLLTLIAPTWAVLTLYTANANLTFAAVSAGFPRSNPEAPIDWHYPVTMADPNDACSPLRNAVDGYVVVVLPGGCYPVTKARHLQAARAMGGVVFSYSGALGGVKYLSLTDNEADVSLRLVEVSSADQAAFITFATSHAPNATVELEPDPYDAYYGHPGWLLYTLFIGGFNIILAGLGIYRIYGFIRVKRLGVGFYTYSLITASSLMRIVSVLDPNGYFGLIPRPARGVFFGFPLVFNIAATVTTAFHWIEVFDRENLRTNLTGLRRFRWPCLVVIVVIFVIDIVQVTLSASLIDSLPLTIIAGVFDTICNVAVFVFFAYACHLIRVYLKENAQLKATKVILVRLLGLGIIQCCCLVGYFIVGAVFATPAGSDFRLSAGLTLLLNSLVTIMALSQSFMFTDPLRYHVSSRGASTAPSEGVGGSQVYQSSSDETVALP